MTYNPLQTVRVDLFKTDFESGLPSDITLVNDTTNTWTLGSAETHTGDTALYISSDTGTTNTYDHTSLQVSHFYIDVDIPEVSAKSYLEFYYKGIGSADSSYLNVFQIETIAGVSAGTQYDPYDGEPLGWDPNLGYTTTTGKAYALQSVWMREFIELDISDYRGDSKRILFTWVNTGSELAANNPPIAIDNIRIFSTMFQNEALGL